MYPSPADKDSYPTLLESVFILAGLLALSPFVLFCLMLAKIGERMKDNEVEEGLKLSIEAQDPQEKDPQDVIEVVTKDE